jgi:hypothetical protein
MSDNTVVRRTPNPGTRWWLPVLLVVIIVAIIAGWFFATHPHAFGSSATSTPTATPTSGPTATPQPGPTGTPAPGPTGTPAASGAPTATPAGTAVSIGTPASSPRTGNITYPATVVSAIQQGANRHDPNYTFYLDPRQVVMQDLPVLGYPSGFTIVKPAAPPAPTATPFTDASGRPETQFVVQSGGKNYTVILNQPSQHGASGIWLITTINPS